MMPSEDGGNRIDAIVSAIISKAENGDTKAFEVIRDTLGEKPTDKVQQEVSGPGGGPVSSELVVRFVEADHADG